MFGHGYTGNQRHEPSRSIFKKRAWFPVKSSSKKWIWWKTYYQISVYYDKNGKPPIHALAWTYILTENEFLVWQLKNPPEDGYTYEKFGTTVYLGEGF